MEKPVYYRRGIFDSWWLHRSYDLLVCILTLGQAQKLRKLVTDAVPQARSIVDFGTGTGDVAIALKKAFPAAAVTGIDLSGNMIAVARKKAERLGVSVGFAVADFAHTALPGRHADAVAISFAIHEVPQPIRVKVVSEAYRLLRRNGRFVILEYQRPPHPVMKLLMRVHFFLFEPQYAQSIFREDLQGELKAAGFRSVSVSTHFFCSVQRVVGVK